MHASRKTLLALTALISVSALAEVAPLPIAQTPLFLRQPEAPLNLMVIGRDHKLHYEAYNDASDLNSDGVVDVGYKPASVTYYGNFDSFMCYDYNGSYFTPVSRTSTKKCSGNWSGDFLNYVTTSRVDALRKVLYGGKRSTDTTALTVIERGFVPQDGHSWAKEYTSVANDGYNIAEYTPLAVPSQANVKHLFGSVNLQSNVSTPLMRVLPNTRFRVWNWASIEQPVLANNRCFNDQNQVRDCRVTTAGEQFEVVPAAWFAGLSRVTYRRESTNSAEDDSLTSRTIFETLAATVIGRNPSRRCGSVGVANIDGNTHTFNGDSGADNGTTAPDGRRCDRVGDNDWFLTDINGTLIIPETRNYVFRISGDDASMLYIDGVYRGGDFVGADSERVVTLNLTAGNHTIRFLHAENTGGQSYRLEYSIGNYPLSNVTDYIVRTQVCKPGILEENCRGYPSGATVVARHKPTGLFHEYGEDDTMMFGLLTGSYRNNQAGGILRKAVVSFTNELDLTTGLFNPSTNGIVSTLDKLQVTGFGPPTGSYNYSNSNAQCPGLSRTITRNECYAWGNPLGEMMYEGMRYFAGESSATSSFIDSSGITTNWDANLGLPEVTWSTTLNPYRPRSAGGFSVCAKPFMTVISDINPSYDTDMLPSVSSIAGRSISVTALGDQMWANEFGGARNVFIGESGALNDNAPTVKNVTSFGNIRGLSPEEPTKKGGFYSASVAYWGLKNDVNPGTGIQKVRTFSVALASPLPRIEFPVGQRVISLVPFGKTVSGTFGGDANFKPTNTIVDFYVEALGNFPGVEQFPAINGGRPFARFRINYEDVEQGNDHDMDAIIRYNLELLDETTLRVRLTSEYAAGSANQNLGYIISGTTKDGVYLEVRDLDSAQGTSVYRLNTPAGVDAGQCALATPPTACNTGLTFTADRTFTVNTAGNAGTTLLDPLWFAAKYGGFNDKSPAEGVPGNGLPDNGSDTSEWDESGPNGNEPDGNPDNYFLVTNALTLSQQLREAFQRVLEISRPLGKLSTNSTRINGRTLLYQAEYDSRDWTGDVRAYRFDETQLDLGAEVWNASSKVPAYADRKVFTFNPTSGSSGAGVAFSLGNLSDAQKTSLHATDDAIRQQLIDYIKGDNSRERARGGNFRDRSKRIGDIANSNPAVMSRESYGYERSRVIADAASYTAFLETKAARGDFVFVGANDGMLHAFDGSATSNGGTEVFAFIPNGVFSNLKSLADPSYEHKFFVDGAPTLGDVKIGGAWRTVLVGTLGSGGRSVYALDVNNPYSFSASSVLWEFTDPDLGTSIGQPRIAALPDGRFAAIFGNGYNSASHRAFLFVVDIATGQLIRKIDTGLGSALDVNGLGSPVALDASGVTKPAVNKVRVPYAPTAGSVEQFVFDQRADTVFAGDLQGVVWKFDISSANPASWTAVRLYQARDAADRPQRITGAPQGAAHPLGGVLVFFGTGRYFTTTDNDNEPTDPKNTFYAVWDNGLHTLTSASSSISKSMLMPRTLGASVTVDGEVFRTVEAPSFEWGDKFGYYLDLTGAFALDGERILAQPLVRFGRVFFNTFAPNVNLTEECQPGGRGFLMVLSAFAGVPADLLSNGRPCPGCAGIGRTTDSPPGEPTLLTGEGVLVDVRPKDTDDETGETTGGSKVLGRPYGQLSWRELK